MNVTVFGLGKLGLPMAAVFANAGHNVIGVDTVEATIEALNRGEVLIDEPDLPEMVARNTDRIRATTNVAEAIAASEMSFIIVPTPSGSDGAFINDYVLGVLRSIGEELRANPRDHIIAIASTVMPGATDKILAPAFEEALGRPLGTDVHLCYSPEFIALGSVVRDLTHPDMILIGATDRKAGERLGDFYRSVSGADVPVQVMAWANAELTKIAVNTFVTTKISFANMLAEICESLPGGDVDEVTSALGLDSRIGRKYLKGGPPYGGPCFPRDNRALTVFAESVGARADIAAATDAINDAIPHRIVQDIVNTIPAGSKVAVIGLAYKDNTPVFEESAGLKATIALLAAGFDVHVFDPKALISHDARLTASTQASTVAEAVTEASAVIITSDNSSHADGVVSAAPNAMIIDCWRTLSPASAARQLGRA